MKKYTKPAIEVVEANLSTNCMQGVTSQVGQGQFAPGKKDKDYDDEDDGFSAGW